MLESNLHKRILSVAAGLSFAMVVNAADMSQTQEVVASVAGMPEIQTQNGISYVSGGVGDESQEAMKQLAREFNLRLVFSVKQGDYLADIPVVIKDRQGNTVLETVSSEPLLYANLEPGRYTVMAGADGKTRTRQVNVRANSPAMVHFAW